MFFWRRSWVIILGLVFNLGLVSCEDPKIAQCQDLMEVVQQGHRIIVAKQEQKDIEIRSQLSQELKAVVERIETVSSEDETLKNLQERFAKKFQRLSDALREISLALETAEKSEVTPVGRQQLKNAKNKIIEMGEVATKIINDQDALIEEMISYCKN